MSIDTDIENVNPDFDEDEKGLEEAIADSLEEWPYDEDSEEEMPW